MEKEMDVKEAVKRKRKAMSPEERELEEKVVEIAMLQMMDLDEIVEKELEKLKCRYGPATVEWQIRVSGFWVILGKHIDPSSTDAETEG